MISRDDGESSSTGMGSILGIPRPPERRTGSTRTVLRATGFLTPVSPRPLPPTGQTETVEATGTTNVPVRERIEPEIIEPARPSSIRSARLQIRVVVAAAFAAIAIIICQYAPEGLKGVERDLLRAVFRLPRWPTDALVTLSQVLAA